MNSSSRCWRWAEPAAEVREQRRGMRNRMRRGAGGAVGVMAGRRLLLPETHGKLAAEVHRRGSACREEGEGGLS